MLGDVFVSELTVEGKLTAHTALGDVECLSCDVTGKTAISTNLGDILYALDESIDGREAEVMTNLGAIELQMDFAENECSYDLRTSQGNIMVNNRQEKAKAIAKSSSGCSVKAKSSLGDVSAFFTTKT